MNENLCVWEGKVLLMKKIMISMMSALTGVAIGAGVSGKVIGDAVTKTKGMSDKHLALFFIKSIDFI